ncbi:cytochrome b-c1 complex subunit 8 [Dendroctonus ponderosae]|uniref:Cytochrome b-c1 complex subunit 8 n=1 Tax=Dendroctonus ponderosae TaxID=77166 RepID=U4V0Q0_DENPD|nr:cytochrome b-c1 complex subunit 8 [Dendroctonus ponderosae]ERL96261.1 hypothetical protein D910_01672 [Dendroctonus ponderosae]KAH1026983.1 hypothetical protein HUJ05_000566 [Dendroctonus ponderosae]KAH1026984.1 hypothetical protein HUJ05_000566 [Dendroctonus ponderosae]
MGHGFGNLWKFRGIITYRLSPFELRAFAGTINPGIPNTIRRILENVPYMSPLAVAYLVYDGVEKAHKETMKKNPADFENDQ